MVCSLDGVIVVDDVKESKNKGTKGGKEEDKKGVFEISLKVCDKEYQKGSNRRYMNDAIIVNED